jgi:alpha-beta hydrolase superfamily lysophospholipase
MSTPTAPRETWTTTPDQVIHAFFSDPPEDPRPHAPLVVVLPGLGLPQYLFPAADAIARRGVRCAVLDLPGLGGTRRHGSRRDVHDIGRVAAQWVTETDAGGPVVVLGHSTGAQAALSAALELQDTHAQLSLVLAGPTFTPRQRRLGRLAVATLTAYRRDSPAELVVAPTALREVSGVWSVLRSGMRDVPDERIRKLRVPLTLTAGEADTFSPIDWLQRLAAATASPSVTVCALPGSHNNPFTHPDELADVVVEAVSRASSAL